MEVVDYYNFKVRVVQDRYKTFLQKLFIVLNAALRYFAGNFSVSEQVQYIPFGIQYEYFYRP